MANTNEINKNFSPGISHPFYFIRHGLLKVIKKWASSLNGKLLDFGCGSKPYRSLFNVEEYIGLDFEKTGHDHSNEEIDVFYDGKTIPFADEYFDSILCSEVVEHLFDLPATLSEMNRVLKKGGKLLITCPFAWGEHEVPYDFARYTQFALKDILEKKGFRVIHYEKSGNFTEAITQMRILYLDEWVNRSGFLKGMMIIWMNILGRFKSWLFPVSYDFYLSNILLAEKQ